MQNTKQILATTTSTEQYLREHMRKAAGWLDDVFMHTLPDGANRPPKLQTHDCNMEVTQGKTQAHEVGEKGDSMSLYSRICSPVVDPKETLPFTLN